MSQSAYDNHLRKIRQPSKQNSQMIPTATQDTEISSVDQSTNNPSQASPQSLQMSSLLEGLSEDAVNRFLKMEIEKLNLTKPSNTMKSCDLVAEQIPKIVVTIPVRLGLAQQIIHATKQYVKALDGAITTCGTPLFKNPKANDTYLTPLSASLHTAP
ncbi:hypothetical protein PGT21_016498 [Puccinia graminis f. sp. tritici]|nr:hypothetical protein PGT21_016498 [Puccinia graminis f. sp. tritici]